MIKKLFVSVLLALNLASLVFAGTRTMDDNTYGLLGKLTGANMNTTSDQAITLNSANYIIRRIIVKNSSINLTTAVGGVYTATSKGGTAVVANSQVYTALTAAGKFVDLTLAAAATTDLQTATTLYLSLTTPQGATATADFYVYGERLD